MNAMHSPGCAILWQLWRPHRWVVAAEVAYLCMAVLLSHALTSEISLTVGDTQVPAIGYVLGLTCLWVPLHLIVMFTFASLPVLESGFPLWMLVLPVRVGTLIAWPMLVGWMAVAVVWLIIAGLVFRPAGIVVPLGWPAAAAAVFLAVAQVTSWMPVAIGWLRTALMLLFMLVLSGMVSLAHATDASEPVLAGSLAASLPLFFCAAAYGVARARRGEVIDLAAWHRLVERVTTWRAPAGRPFSSASAAQLWLEWRRSGLVLPAFVGMMLLIMALPLFVREPNDSRSIVRLLPVVLLLPPFVAGMLRGSLGKEDLWSGYARSPFAGTRPLSSAAIVRCKMVMAALSSVATWALVLAGLAPLSLHPEFSRMLSQVAAGVPAWKLVIHGMLIVFGLVVFTWLQLVQNLWIGLTGRAWVTHAVHIGFGIVLIGGFICGWWIYMHPELLDRLRPGAIWLLAALALAKLATAVWVLRASGRYRLVTPRQALAMIATWSVVVAGLSMAALGWLPLQTVSTPVAVTGIALFVPFSRLAGTPLALYWNRHR